jgi:MFS family permease
MLTSTLLGFFPAASFLLTLFYKRYEVLTRLAIFYSAASLSGAFGGLFAFALEKMDGLGGLEGWRWCVDLQRPPNHDQLTLYEGSSSSKASCPSSPALLPSSLFQIARRLATS